MYCMSVCCVILCSCSNIVACSVCVDLDFSSLCTSASLLAVHSGDRNGQIPRRDSKTESHPCVCAALRSLAAASGQMLGTHALVPI